MEVGDEEAVPAVLKSGRREMKAATQLTFSLLFSLGPCSGWIFLLQWNSWETLSQTYPVSYLLDDSKSHQVGRGG